MKAGLEEMESVVEHQEVRKEKTAVETIRVLEDQYGDWHLAIARHRQLNKWTQVSGWSHKKLAAACRRMTCRVIPARRKGCGHKGLTVEKRRQRKWTKDYVV
jgi:ribosomal protein L37E